MHHGDYCRLVRHREYLGRMTALPLLIFIMAASWAITQSAKRWITALWIVVSTAVVIGLAYVLSLAMPYGAAILGHAAAPLCLLVPSVVAVAHARAHRRVKASPPAEKSSP